MRKASGILKVVAAFVRSNLGVERLASGSVSGNRSRKSRRTGTRLPRESLRAASRRSVRGESRMMAGTSEWVAASWAAREAPVPMP
jgi:hypothetical protein